MGQKREEKILLDKLLTPVEHFFIGSTLGQEYAQKPHLPKILIEEGVSAAKVAEVNRQRQQRREFSGLMVGSIFFGLDFLKETALIGLCELDPISGKAKEMPRLVGIKRQDGEEIREGLENYQLTEQGRRELREAFGTLDSGFETKG